MVTTLISDLSGVILFKKDPNYQGTLNGLYSDLASKGSFNFADHFSVNDVLLEYYKSLAIKINLYLYTAGTIQNAPELKPRLEPIFKAIYSAEELNAPKDATTSYGKIVTELIGVTIPEVIFIDDQQNYLNAAAGIGLTTIHYRDNMQAIAAIDELLGV